MRRRAILWTALVVAGVAGVVAWLAGGDRGGSARAPASDGASGAPPCRAPSPPRWTDGTRRVYRVTYEGTRGQALLPIAAAPEDDEAGRALVPSSTDVVARVELVGRGRNGPNWRVHLRIERLERYGVQLAGRDLFPDLDRVRSTFEGPVAELTLSDDGEVLAFGFSADASPVFQNLVQMLWLDAQVRVPPALCGAPPLAGTPPPRTPASQRHVTAWRWRLEERSWIGRGPVEYAAEATASGWRLHKRRTRYAAALGKGPLPDGVAQQVSLDATARVDDSGKLVTLRSHETVRLDTAGGTSWLRADTRVQWDLVDAGAVAKRRRPTNPPDVAVVRRPGEVAQAAARAEQALRARAAGLTADEVVATLRQFGKIGEVPDHNRFLWRAVAVLRLEPALCDRLAELFDDDVVGFKGRELIADLLVGADTPAAQAALRAALDRLDAHPDDRNPFLVQRLGLVRHPDEATLDFIARRFARGDDLDSLAAGGSLGAAAGWIAAAGDPERAAAIAAPIVERLAHAEAPQTRALLLRALGNTRMERYAPLLVAEAGAEDVQVRHAVAIALRHMDTPQARRALLTLATDPQPLVQRVAIRSLRVGTLDDAAAQALAQAVAAGKIHPSAFHDLLNAATPVARRPAVRALLRAMLARPIDDRDVRHRLRALLGGP